MKLSNAVLRVLETRSRRRDMSSDMLLWCLLYNDFGTDDKVEIEDNISELEEVWDDSERGGLREIIVYSGRDE